MSIEEEHWQVVLKRGIQLYLEQACRAPAAHIKDTPERVVRSYFDYASGYLEDPANYLKTAFEDKQGYNGMLHVWGVPVISMCSHHILPIIGTAHFAYIPKNRKIVGLSKIPRFIEILSRRLQVQENLTEEIVDTFQTTVDPAGCAVDISAIHCCMSVRGVGVRGAVTQTTAHRGCFKSGESRVEFQMATEPKAILI